MNTPPIRDLARKPRSALAFIFRRHNVNVSSIPSSLKHLLSRFTSLVKVSRRYQHEVFRASRIRAYRRQDACGNKDSWVDPRVSLFATDHWTFRACLTSSRDGTFLKSGQNPQPMAATCLLRNLYLRKMMKARHDPLAPRRIIQL